MAIKTVLFDLDGTLLPMDQEVFTKAYFKGLSEKVVPLGYGASDLVKSIWTGTAAMVKNDGSRTNESAFWAEFAKIYGDRVYKDIPFFDEFYETDFQKVKAVCGFQPLAKSLIDRLKESEIRVVLATNPIFPKIAPYSRIKWAGLEPDSFELITTYENSVHCKPNPLYYSDILKSINELPENCLMVGNDVSEDMIASSLGMKVFLLTDDMINKQNEDISNYPKGDFIQMTEYVLSQIK